MTRTVIHNNEAKSKLFEGVEELYNVVSSTLGPLGNTVIIEDQFGGTPVITKDGVTVARNLKLKDQVKNLGVEIVRHVASKTEELVGDGTTTATVLAYNLCKICQKLLTEGLSKIDLINTIKEFSDKVCELIDRDTIKELTESDVYNIAMISSNGDKEVSEVIKNAFISVGSTGHITVDVSNTVKTDLHISNGTELNAGYVSPYFINDRATGECILRNCLVLLSSVPIVGDNDIISSLRIANSEKRPIFIMAPAVVGDALSTFIVNVQKQNVSGCAIKIPNFSNPIETLKDLSLLTGASIYPDCGKLSEVTIDKLGYAERIVISNKSTILSGFKTSDAEINSYIDYLENNIRPNLKFYEQPAFELRLSRIRSKTATIKVGGQTELEVNERKDRVDDATFAVKAALESGIVIGAGKELLNISNDLKDSKYSNLASILSTPYYKILSNGNYNWEALEGFGRDECVDLRSNKSGNFREIGVVDPAAVTKTAIKNAVSIVEVLLSTNNVMICDEVKSTPLTDKLYT